MKTRLLAFTAVGMLLAGSQVFAADAPAISGLKGDAAAGEKTAKACAVCHTFDKGGANKIGPNLYGIAGNNHAHLEGFKYSDAIKALHDKKWTDDELNQFLFAPAAHIKGTKMTFAGVKNDQDRANVIAYLHTLSDKK